MTKVKNNNVLFNIRLDRELKDRFLRVAKENDQDGAKLLRKMIKEYCSSNAQLFLK